MNLVTLTENKKVLMIPIYSARSRETGKYNLEHDGNYSRVCAFLKQQCAKSVDVCVPYNLENWNLKSFKNVNYFKLKTYGENAKATRESFDIYRELCDDFEHYDVIISEPNFLTRQLADSKYHDKVIYWCVASTTSVGTPWFVEAYSLLDAKLAKDVITAVANDAQCEKLRGKSYVETIFADVDDNETVIYFPFRLTDNSYHADVFVKAIEKLSNVRKVKVFYPDLNDSKLFDELDKDVFIKVPSIHALYTQVLKAKPIIPYLENADMIEHISINEFLHYGCKLVMLKPRFNIERYENAVFINELNAKELANAILKQM